jgi:hypothetical protein
MMEVRDHRVRPARKVNVVSRVSTERMQIEDYLVQLVHRDRSGDRDCRYAYAGIVK